MNGFSNALTFSEITLEDLKEVEQFVRYDLLQIIQDKCQSENLALDHKTKVDFFGLYADDESNFEFSEDSKILIKQLIHHTKETLIGLGLDDGLANFQASIDAVDHASAWFFTDATSKEEFVHKQCSDTTHETIVDQSFVFETNKISQTKYILDKLLNTVNKNASTSKDGWRYDEEVRNWAAYLRMRAGPLAYNDLQRNLEGALPALSTTNRYIQRSSTSLIEGVLRSHELLIYLQERDLPLIVALSEDATRIEGRVQYDTSTNQLIGFVLPTNSNGMPIPFSYHARSAEEIVGHFTRNKSAATFVNTIMAQPIASIPPFCLMIFGSDGKFTTECVSKRWQFITTELRKINIFVITFSSDRDPRYNAAMRKNFTQCLQSTHMFSFDCFDCTKSVDIPYYVQDTTHIGTKMRNFLLKTLNDPDMLPFGRFFIDIGHIKYLLDNIPKDRHQITETTLNPNDRQNFSSVLRLCDSVVINQLKLTVKNSQGTIAYLQIMRNYIDAFMDDSLLPLERVNKIWYSIFLVRIWRNYILNRKLPLKNNFLTSNCYSCLEINAHTLILILLYVKKEI